PHDKAEAKRHGVHGKICEQCPRNAHPEEPANEEELDNESRHDRWPRGDSAGEQQGSPDEISVGDCWKQEKGCCNNGRSPSNVGLLALIAHREAFMVLVSLLPGNPGKRAFNGGATRSDQVAS